MTLLKCIALVSSRLLTFTLFSAALVSCGTASGGVSGTATDPRIVAIQTGLDSSYTWPSADVASGPVCAYKLSGLSLSPALNPKTYASIPGAHVSRSRQDGATLCYKVTWDPSVGVKVVQPCPMCSQRSAIKIGRYIVDKVGAEQTTSYGSGMSTSMTPYKAHFQANKIGKALIDAKMAKAPVDITDGQASLHKDADGKWIAEKRSD